MFREMRRFKQQITTEECKKGVEGGEEGSVFGNR